MMMESAFELKSLRLEAFTLRLHTLDDVAIEALLQEKQDKYQSLVSFPFVLDVADLPAHEADLAAILALFQAQGLSIVAVRASSDAWRELAQAVNVLFLKSADKAVTAENVQAASDENAASESAEDETIEVQAENVVEEVQAALSDDEQAEQPAVAETEVETVEVESELEPVPEFTARPTLVINTPVRTGQQVYAKNADLIVLGMVSEGAEVIADGNIHIYAPMRGRALAGESGDKTARIFMQSMQAELVSIAGIYRVFEQDLPPHLHKQAVRIELQEDDRLSVAAIVAQ